VVNSFKEKAGGVRGVLAAVECAAKLQLKVMIGSMVGSDLVCGTAAHFLPIAIAGDLDGGLLIQSSSSPFKPAFQWKHTPLPHVQLSKSSPHGLTVAPKESLATIK
jgi:L-alanine-DL-glutamate epimerase-like enolase superfamily enzyme